MTANRLSSDRTRLFMMPSVPPRPDSLKNERLRLGGRPRTPCANYELTVASTSLSRSP